MAYQDHEIDPTGDAFMIVETRASELYLWFVKADSQSKLWSELVDISEGRLPSQHRIINSDTSSPTTSPSSSPRLDSPALTMGSTYSSPHDSNHELNPGPEQLRVRVSSKPLALASSYFGRLLANSRTVLLPDVWEEFRGDITQPLLLILRAIHGQNRKVPRSLGFQMMYKVAFLADYFGCSEAVEIFADTWIRNAEGLLPKSYTVDVPRWLCIAWVLRHHDLFTAVTCLAIRETKAPIVRYDNSPVPEEVFYTIAKTREEYMEEILTSVFDYVDTLSLDDSTTCCPDCASLILGLLLRQLTSLKLYPQPLPPYFTHNVDELLKSLPTLEPPRCSAHVHKLNGCHGRCAVLLPRTGEVLQKIEAKMKGLDLADYVDIDWVPHAA